MSDANTPEWHMDSAMEMRVDAELCLEGGGLGTASNRLYYACFRAAQAALVSVGVEPPKTHKGTRMLFRKHLVVAESKVQNHPMGEMSSSVLGLLIGSGIGCYVGKSPGTDTTRRGSKSELSSRS